MDRACRSGYEIYSDERYSSHKREIKMAAPEHKFYGYSAAWLKLLQTKSAFLICVTLLTTIVYGQHFTTLKSDEGIEILENHKKVLFYQVRPK